MAYHQPRTPPCFRWVGLHHTAQGLLLRFIEVEDVELYPGFSDVRGTARDVQPPQLLMMLWNGRYHCEEQRQCVCRFVCEHFENAQNKLFQKLCFEHFQNA